MNERFWRAVAGVMLFVFFIAMAIMTISSFGCRETEAEDVLVYRKWTSPNAGAAWSVAVSGDTTFVPHTLDRVVILEYTEPITMANIISASVIATQNDPAPEGETDSVQILQRTGYWYCAVTYAVELPNNPSEPGNSISTSPVMAIIDLR